MNYQSIVIPFGDFRGVFNRLDDYYSFLESPKSILCLSTAVRIGRLCPDRSKS